LKNPSKRVVKITIVPYIGGLSLPLLPTKGVTLKFWYKHRYPQNLGSGEFGIWGAKSRGSTIQAECMILPESLIQ
jgi:hypothetical protein